jgi:hypothetical protein
MNIFKSLLKKKNIINHNTNSKNKYPLSGNLVYHYNERPKSTIIINHYTSLETLLKTIKNLRVLGDEVEIIVINDSKKKSDKISRSLSHSNDKLIVTQDLGEIRGYKNGANLSSSSDFLIFSQDDDLAPNNANWYNDCLKLFEEDPKLALIGLCGGGCFLTQEHEINFQRHKLFGKHDKFYCSWLKIGPLIIKKNIYYEIGEWDTYSSIGESAHFTDPDLTIRIWKNGYKAILFLNKNTLQWQRRFQRGDQLTKENIVKRNLNDPVFFLNRDKYILKNKMCFKDIEEKVLIENNKIGITY